MGIDTLRSEIANFRNRRHKLLFIIPNNSNKQLCINDIRNDKIPLINFSLYLADKLRLISPDKRPYEVATWLRKSINEQQNEIVCIHNIEYLFDPELKQNPVKLLEAHSGNTVLLVIWPGKAENGMLYYATPEHPEYYQNSEYSNSIMIY
jgi:hypothetical protein